MEYRAFTRWVEAACEEVHVTGVEMLPGARFCSGSDPAAATALLHERLTAVHRRHAQQDAAMSDAA